MKLLSAAALLFLVLTQYQGKLLQRIRRITNTHCSFQALLRVQAILLSKASSKEPYQMRLMDTPH
jgi:hypothetical protein